MKDESASVVKGANIGIAMSILSVLSSLFLVIVIMIIKINLGVADWVAKLSDVTETITGGLSFIISIIFYIILIIWLRVSYGRLHDRGVVLRFPVWWSVGGWFIPIWNFFRPYQVVKDLFVKTNHLSLSNIDKWWTFTIISFIVGRMSFQAGRAVDPNTGEGFLAATIMQGIAGVLCIMVYLFAKRMVKEYLKVESDLVAAED